MIPVSPAKHSNVHSPGDGQVWGDTGKTGVTGGCSPETVSPFFFAHLPETGNRRFCVLKV